MSKPMSLADTLRYVQARIGSLIPVIEADMPLNAAAPELFAVAVRLVNGYRLVDLDLKSLHREALEAVSKAVGEDVSGRRLLCESCGGECEGEDELGYFLCESCADKEGDK